MVSKAAVIAIVGILAVPILLGYALNLEQTTEIDYQTTGDSVNVTQLLQTGTDYTYAHADTYQLNTSFITGQTSILPYYEKTTVSKTALPVSRTYYTTGQYLSETRTYNTWVYMYYQANYSYSDPVGITFRTLDTNNNIVMYVNQIRSWYWNAADSTVEYTYYSSSVRGYQNGTYTVPDANYSYQFLATAQSGFTGTGYLERQWVNGEGRNVDFSAGFRLEFTQHNLYHGETYNNTYLEIPSYTKNVTITINLDSITDASYSFGLGSTCYIEKTTTDGVVSWKVKPRPDIVYDPPEVTELYYDPSLSNNTYQIKFWIDPNGTPVSNPQGYNTYTLHQEFRYVGAWPSSIGEANYYKSYDIQSNVTPSLAPNLDSTYLLFGGFTPRSPVMRVDDAEFRAMEYQVISDKTYDPAAFKTNPATTINDPIAYGSSITFGGNTYTVKKGNITMGSHDIPVKGLVLSSVPNDGGGYDNKIGNTVISNTAAPSAITFNGKWSASITTAAQEEYEITKTEWKAGDFAWDGMDQNFLMVGLLASLGAFIALGIYARRSRASVWPLLIVCGGAALLFFVML